MTRHPTTPGAGGGLEAGLAQSKAPAAGPLRDPQSTRVDGLAKVTGAATYSIDVSRDGMLHGVIVRANRAHAVLTQVNVEAARGLQGVVDVLVGEDLTALFPRFGHLIADHPVLAIGRVRYWGEPVALVLAETLDAGRDAAQLVTIEYDDLDVMLTPDAALDADAPLLHEENYEGAERSFGSFEGADNPSNVCYENQIEWGNVDQEFPDSVTVETTTEYPMLYAYAMEPYNALASVTDDRIEIHSPAQHPFQVQRDIARIFSRPLSHVRITSNYIGGGYGSKSYTKVEPLAAVGAWRTGRPVRVALSIEESIYTTRADSAVVNMRSVFTQNGVLLARDVDLTLNTGAYADNGPLVCARAIDRSFGPYRVPNVRVRGRAVYTNTVPSSSYRGFGTPQVNLACEVNIEQAAEVLGLTSWEIRERNLLHRGEELLPGNRGMDADLHADLQLLREVMERAVRREPEDGIVVSGVACSASQAGAFPTSTSTVRLLVDGSVIVMSGATEMGQGSQTVLAEIAAHELGVPREVIRVAQGDTAQATYERTTGASRTTVIAGTALVRACTDLKLRLTSMLAEVLGVEEADVVPDAGGFRVNEVFHGYASVVQEWFGSHTGEAIGFGVVRRHGEFAAMPTTWEIGIGGVRLHIDPETGATRLHDVVTIEDVGFAINPRGVKAQALGAATQGLGGALHEELVYGENPHPVNANITDYRVPRSSDLPDNFVSVLVERRDGVGPYGAKGGGEGALNPMGAAVAIAVGRAVGFWPTVLPLTPERIWTMLRTRDRISDTTSL